MSPSASKPPRKADDGPRLSADEKEFIMAAANGDAEKARQLLAKGVPVDVRDCETWTLGFVWNITALMCAAGKGHLEVVRLLLQAGADVSAVCETSREGGGAGGGEPALHFALKGNHLAVAEALLDAGADPNALGGYGRSPLTIAIAENNLDALRLLLKRGADVNLKPKNKDYVLPLLAATALKKGDKRASKQFGDRMLTIYVPDLRSPEMFYLLLEAGADPSATGGRGRTPLISLAWEGDVPDETLIPMMEALLKAGAKADHQEQDGDTALQGAAIRNNAAAIKLLVGAGADFNRVFKRGTALDMAEQNLKLAQKALGEVAANSPWLEDAQKDVARPQAVVDVLTGLGAKRKSDLPPPEPAAPDAVDPTPIGAAHFLKFIYDGQAEWTLVTVKAPLKKVADELEKMSGAKKRDRDVSLRNAGEEPEEVAQLVAVVQPEGNPWTVIFRTIYHANSDALKGVVEWAKSFSKTLKTQAISFASEDTSGALAYDLFEKGKLVERAEWEGEDGFHYFESTRREEPELEAIDHKFVDQLFRELGIYLPACYPTIRGKRPLLLIDKLSADTIQRADLFAL
jgi:ankyrin repeat protein